MNAWYTIILFIHILAGITWVGAHVFYSGTVYSALKREGRIAADQVMARLEWADKPLFIPASLLVLATGLAMVFMSTGIRFTNLWIIIALGLYLVSMGVGGGRSAQLYKGILAHREAGTQDSPEFGRLLSSYLRAGSYDTLALIGIVAMMVFRPL
jgi:uncharacterized membrane protein